MFCALEASRVLLESTPYGVEGGNRVSATTPDDDTDLNAENARDRRILIATLAINLTPSAGGAAVGILAVSTAVAGAALDNPSDVSAGPRTPRYALPGSPAGSRSPSRRYCSCT